MFKIDGTNITITRGDTGIFSLNIKNASGQDYDFSSDTVLLTVKANTYTSDKLIQKTVTYGENITIAPADTEHLNYGEYVYDVQLTTAGGIVDTIIQPSKFIVLPEVTF